MKPLFSPENDPHCPFLFASAPDPIVNNDTKPSAYIYRNIWSVVENLNGTYSTTAEKVKDQKSIPTVLERASFQLQTEKFGIETALNTLQSVSEDFLQFKPEISLYKAELLRKQCTFVAAAENYTKFLNATCYQNEDKYHEHKTCAHLILAIVK